jgi:hypothetical protein
MKHLFTFLLVAISATSFAQGNLQFNQVINNEFSAANTISAQWHNVGTISVPSNKVWKITSGSSFGTNNNGDQYSLLGGIRINNHIIYHQASPSQNTPFWLESGTHTVYLFGSSNQTIYQYQKGSINAVEFNVIP